MYYKALVQQKKHIFFGEKMCKTNNKFSHEFDNFFYGFSCQIPLC